MASLLPAARLLELRISAAAKSWPKESARTAPVRSRAASNTVSVPISAPVCVAAAAELEA